MSQHLDAGKDMYYEDFRVGQIFRSDEHVITEQEHLLYTDVCRDYSPLHVDEEYARTSQFGHRVLHGPFGLALFLGELYKTRTVDKTAMALLDTNWRYVKPIFIGDRLHFDITITRCRRARSGDRGIVNRHVVLSRADGTVVQEGTTAFMVKARGAGDETSTDWALDFCSDRWASELAARLNDDAAFVVGAESFDGTIGLQAGTVETQLRVYRGRVLEVSPRTLLGATFTVHGSELVWTRLITGARNEFVQRALRREFSVSGSAYDYLRLTKALMRVWDCARELASQENHD